MKENRGRGVLYLIVALKASMVGLTPAPRLRSSLILPVGVVKPVTLHFVDMGVDPGFYETSMDSWRPCSLN